VRDRDQPDTLVDRRTELLEIDVPLLVVADDHDLHTARACDMKVGHVVAAVLRSSGDDSIPGLEWDRVEDRVPGARGVLEQRDLLGPAVDEPRARPIDSFHPLALGLGRLVSADPGLELEVVDDRVDHGPRHQRGAGIVEVEPIPTSRRVVAGGLEIYPHNL
jgi:hypothetical protein